MSGLIYLVGAVLLAVAGLGILWLVENVPRRDSLKGVDEFDRARTALRRRHRPGAHGGGMVSEPGGEKGSDESARDAPSTVKILR